MANDESERRLCGIAVRVGKDVVMVSGPVGAHRAVCAHDAGAPRSERYQVDAELLKQLSIAMGLAHRMAEG